MNRAEQASKTIEILNNKLAETMEVITALENYEKVLKRNKTKPVELLETRIELRAMNAKREFLFTALQEMKGGDIK